MADKRPRPFSRQLEAEKRPLLEQPFTVEDRALETAKEGLLKRTDPLRVRYLGLTHHQQAVLLASSGAVLVAVMWTILGVAPEILQTLLEIPRAGLLVFGGSMIGPWLMFYGVLRLVIPEVEAPPPGARFGGVLTEARDAGRWKMQLSAIALAILHTILFMNAF
jgi:hypothetical protein